MSEMKEKFIAFLKKEGVYVKFTNKIPSIDNYLKSIEKHGTWHDAVSSAFIWYEWVLWSDIDGKWRQELNVKQNE